MPPNAVSSKEFFEKTFNVSRETMSALEKFESNLINWSNSINLVSKTTLVDFWTRHAIDSAQLILAAGPKDRDWVDFGSGAGFPGLIIAALLKEGGCDYRVRLIDNSLKRCAFLREAARLIGVNVEVINSDLEVVVPERFNIVTARAFTNLTNLLNYSHQYAALGARMLFLKGENVQTEVDEASTKYSFAFKITPSIAYARGCIIEISELAKIVHS